MQLSHTVMAALLGGADGADPAPADTIVEIERDSPSRPPTELLTRMALGEAGQPAWDYDFEPWPPCSFG